jgi:hypothetical protein
MQATYASNSNNSAIAAAARYAARKKHDRVSYQQLHKRQGFLPL